MADIRNELLQDTGPKQYLFPFIQKALKALSGRDIGKIPGVFPLFVFFYHLICPRGIALINCNEHKLFVNTQDDAIAPFLVMTGVYEKYETEIFKSFVKPGMTVIDVGANIGYYTLIAAHLVGDSGRVYAFEPEPNNYKLLLKNIEINGYKNIIAYQKAVSQSNGKAKLFISKTNLGGHSLLQGNVQGESRYFTEVETVSLDWFMDTVIKNPRVDFIKMDIEGAEGLAIRGAERTLSENANLNMMMEFTPDALRKMGTEPADVLNEIHKYGFKITVIRNSKLDEDPVDKKIIHDCIEHQYLNLILRKK